MVTTISTGSQVEIPGFSLNSNMKEPVLHLVVSMHPMFQKHLDIVIKHYVAKTNAKYLFIDFSSEAGFFIFKNVYGIRVSVLDWIYNACELADFPIENVTFMHGNSKLEESYEQWYENVGAKIDVPKLAQAKFLNTWDDVVNSAHVDYYEQIDREGKFIKPYVYTFYNGADRQHRLDLLKKLSKNNLLKHGVVTYLEDPKTNDPELDGLEFPIMLPSGSDSNHYDVNSHKKDVNPEFLYSHNWAYLDVVTETIIGTQPIGYRYSFSEAPEWWQTTFYTEKIWRPIYYGRPFILLGAPGQLAELKQHGYETFDDLWSEEYDNIEHLGTRINAITYELEVLSKLDKTKLNKKMSESVIIDKLEHNRQVFNLQNDRFQGFSWNNRKYFIDELKTNFTVHYTDLKQVIEDELEKFISLSVEENYYKETEYSKKLTKLFPKYNNTVMCIDPIGSE
tara:strand:+ start:4667 stop:6016 length:1350 start_codon:yes stop_codon:yes gene_type:complete